LSAADALTAAKKELRAAAALRRRGAAAAAIEAGAWLRDRALGALTLPLGAVVSGYWPLPDELDPRPLLTALHDRGHVIGLPVVVGRGLPLIFRRWRPGQALVKGSFKVETPPESADVVTPAVVLAPLLAFDRAGYRLGYGGGFYDRTIAGFRSRGSLLAVGLAFAAQEVAAVPHGPSDEPLDWIVTEREAIGPLGRPAGGGD